MNLFRCKTCGCTIHTSDSIKDFQSLHLYNNSEDTPCDGQFEIVPASQSTNPNKTSKVKINE